VRVHIPVISAGERAENGKIVIATMVWLQCLTGPSRYAIIVQAKAGNGIRVTIQTAMAEPSIVISVAAAEIKTAVHAGEMGFSKRR